MKIENIKNMKIENIKKIRKIASTEITVLNTFRETPIFLTLLQRQVLAKTLVEQLDSQKAISPEIEKIMELYNNQIKEYLSL